MKRWIIFNVLFVKHIVIGVVKNPRDRHFYNGVQLSNFRYIVQAYRDLRGIK